MKVPETVSPRELSVRAALLSALHDPHSPLNPVFDPLQGACATLADDPVNSVSQVARTLNQTPPPGPPLLYSSMLSGIVHSPRRSQAVLKQTANGAGPFDRLSRWLMGSEHWAQWKGEPLQGHRQLIGTEDPDLHIWSRGRGPDEAPAGPGVITPPPK